MKAGTSMKLAMLNSNTTDYFYNTLDIDYSRWLRSGVPNIALVLEAGALTG